MQMENGSTAAVVFPVLDQPYAKIDGIHIISLVYCFNAKSVGDTTPTFKAVGIIPFLKQLF
jgi:hypothetical protein